MRKLIFLFAFISTFIFGQTPDGSRKAWTDTLKISRSNQFVDIMTVISDSAVSADGVTIDNINGTFAQKVFADTAALTASTDLEAGGRFIVKQLSNSNTAGGGVFVKIPKGYQTTINNVATFLNADGDTLIREEYYQSKIVRPEWAGAIPNDASNDGNAFDLLESAELISNVKIQLSAGQYLISNTSFRVGDSVTVAGDGSATIIKLSGTGSLGARSRNVVTFQDFVIDGNSNDVSGLSIALCKNVNVSRVIIYNTGQHHMAIYGCDSVVVSNLITHQDFDPGADSHGVDLDRDASELTANNRIHINNCIFKNYPGRISFKVENTKGLVVGNTSFFSEVEVIDDVSLTIPNENLTFANTLFYSRLAFFTLDRGDINISNCQILNSHLLAVFNTDAGDSLYSMNINNLLVKYSGKSDIAAIVIGTHGHLNFSNVVIEESYTGGLQLGGTNYGAKTNIDNLIINKCLSDSNAILLVSNFTDEAIFSNLQIDSVYRGIETQSGVSNFTINKALIKRTQKEAIRLTSVTDVSLLEVDIKEGYQDDPGGNEGIVEVTNSTGIEVKGGSIEGAGSSTAAMYFDNMDNSEIKDVDILSGFYGVYARRNCNGLVIDDNTFDGNSGYGVFIEQTTPISTFVEVTNNTIKNAGQRGIYNIGVDKTYIANNRIYDTGGAGSNDAGIWLSSSDSCFVFGNMINSDAAAEYGIRINSGTGNVILGNYLLNSGITANFSNAGTSTIDTVNVK